MEAQQPFKYIFDWLHLAGIWGEHSVRHRFRASMVFLIFLIIPNLMAFLSIFNLNSGYELIRSLSFMGAVIMITGWRVIFYVYESKIKAFLAEMNDIVIENDESRIYVNRALKKAKSCFYIAFGIIIVSVLALPVKMLLTGKLILTFSFVNHIIYEPVCFYIMLIYQTLVFIYAAFLFMCFDQLHLNFMIIIHGYFLFCKDQFLKHDIGERVKTHVNVIRLVGGFNRTFSGIMAFESLIKTYILCASLFLSVETTKDIQTNSNGELMLHMCALLFHIFMPCFMGAMIEQENKSLFRLTYDGDWLDETLSYKKSLIIMNENLKQPISIQASRLIYFNLGTFLTILNHVYTSYAVMLRIKMKYE